MINSDIGKARQVNITRVRDDEPCAPVFGAQDPPGHQGMTGRGIGADDENTAGVFDFGNCVCHGTTAECGGQTGHRRGMSETGAVVHIIGADDGAGKLLRNIIFLVGDFG
jgi:hypothetical protein